MQNSCEKLINQYPFKFHKMENFQCTVCLETLDAKEKCARGEGDMCTCNEGKDICEKCMVKCIAVQLSENQTLRCICCKHPIVVDGQIFKKAKSKALNLEYFFVFICIFIVSLWAFIGFGSIVIKIITGSNIESLAFILVIIILIDIATLIIMIISLVGIAMMIFRVLKQCSKCEV